MTCPLDLRYSTQRRITVHCLPSRRRNSSVLGSEFSRVRKGLLGELTQTRPPKTSHPAFFMVARTSNHNCIMVRARQARKSFTPHYRFLFALEVVEKQKNASGAEIAINCNLFASSQQLLHRFSLDSDGIAQMQSFHRIALECNLMGSHKCKHPITLHTHVRLHSILIGCSQPTL